MFVFLKALLQNKSKLLKIVLNIWGYVNLLSLDISCTYDLKWDFSIDIAHNNLNNWFFYRERQNQELEKQQKEKERLERDRQEQREKLERERERERQEKERELEKERQEQALHNHFEKSLRAAQQKVKILSISRQTHVTITCYGVP